ncbi:UDP binding domain-containing protein [Roseobacter litoralis]|uniref:UDP-binding protein n=1 Tax=Roseobacter litoralis (strain ATCC 49566 / DSM 6996 / JCM 21268 / NBRC 15278 / OCh 149) TaxID=391595 RepID=F7ZJ57_ROSLO|nr:UDP binding domain-containing protein [Roseobacter litoralis]AEI96302.1 putative UDP-binding protein [Roseobacter litoralis Och 149]
MINATVPLVLGIAYKRDIDDVRESPSVLVMELLRNWGADISYSDPHVQTFPVMREHSFDLSSVPLSPETLAQQDAVLLLTDHTHFDYEMIAEHASLLIDTRGVYRRLGITLPTA